MLAELLIEKDVISKEEILERMQSLSDKLIPADWDAAIRNYPAEQVQALLDSVDGGYEFFKRSFVD